MNNSALKNKQTKIVSCVFHQTKVWRQQLSRIKHRTLADLQLYGNLTSVRSRLYYDKGMKISFPATFAKSNHCYFEGARIKWQPPPSVSRLPKPRHGIYHEVTITMYWMDFVFFLSNASTRQLRTGKCSVWHLMQVTFPITKIQARSLTVNTKWK